MYSPFNSMKIQLLILALCLISLLAMIPEEAFSQDKAGGPPPWAPAHGYRAKTRHVYFPDHNFYFDMQKGVYIYLHNGNWTIAAKLPSLYSSTNLQSAVQIELDLTSDNPHRHNNDHLVKYKAKPQKQGKPGNGHEKGKGKGRG